MEALQYDQGLPYPTILRPADNHPWNSLAAVILPPRIPHAVCLWWKWNASQVGGAETARDQPVYGQRGGGEIRQDAPVQLCLLHLLWLLSLGGAPLPCRHQIRRNLLLFKGNVDITSRHVTSRHPMSKDMRVKSYSFSCFFDAIHVNPWL
jgi:hypothetical protein